MKPVEAFQYLLGNNMPLVLSFPLEEEKGRVITGKGVCHIEKIHGGSRITVGRYISKIIFVDHRLLFSLCLSKDSS